MPESADQPVSDRRLPTSPRDLTPLRTGVSYTHMAMSDLLIANPIISQDQLAAHFGYSASWISQILASDAFQAFHAKRTAELIDPALRATIEDRFRGLVYRSQEILMEKLKGPVSTIPDQLALRTMELTSRALGYGAREQVPAVQVNIDNHLEVLGERLTGLLERRKAAVTGATIEGEATDVSKV